MSNKRSGRLIAVVLAVCMVLGSGPAVLLAQASTDIQGHWAEQVISRWVDRKIVDGYPDGTFRPNAPIKRAEFAALINRTLGFITLSSIEFSDMSVDEWFATDVSKAVGAGYMDGYPDGTFRPNANISRQEAAMVLARILGLEATDETFGFTDIETIPAWSLWAVVAVANAGIMTGYPDGSFGPIDSFTRAETVTVLDRLVAEVFTEEGTYGDADEQTVIEGNVIITVGGVTLVNMHITGNLLIAESVGDGVVTLKDVTVDGTVTVSGGEIIEEEATALAHPGGGGPVIPEPTRYAITALVNPVGSGIVSGLGSYSKGTRVTLTAKADDNYQFMNWTDEADELVSNVNPYVFDMPSYDVALTANFAAKPGEVVGNGFTVVKYQNIGLKGYSTEWVLENADFAGAKVQVSLYAGETLLQTNTLRAGHDVVGDTITSPFDVYGSFDYEADGYWVNERFDNGNATRTVIQVVLANGKKITAQQDELIGEPEDIEPKVVSNVEELESAIEQADNGDTIVLTPGRYGLTKTLVVTKSITILGPQADVDPRPSFGSIRTSDEEEAILTGDKGDEDDYGSQVGAKNAGWLASLFEIRAHHVVVNGLTLERTYNHVIYSQTADPTGGDDRTHDLVGLRIVNNIVRHGRGNEGIKIGRSINALVQYNYIHDILHPGDAIEAYDVKGFGILDNEIDGCMSVNGNIRVSNRSGGGPGIVRGNVIRNTGYHFAINAEDGNGHTIIDNNHIIDAKAGGIFIYKNESVSEDTPTLIEVTSNTIDGYATDPIQGGGYKEDYLREAASAISVSFNLKSGIQANVVIEDNTTINGASSIPVLCFGGGTPDASAIATDMSRITVSESFFDNANIKHIKTEGLLVIPGGVPDALQRAIDEVQPGDTVFVAEGEYDIGTSKLFISKPIGLVGAGRDKTKISGTVHRSGLGPNDIVQPMVLTTATTGETLVQGIHFEWKHDEDIGSNYWSALSLAGNGVTIDSCKITTDIPDTEHITIVNIGRSGGNMPGEAGVPAQAIAFTNNIVSGTISIVPSVPGKVLKANVSHNLIEAVNMEGIWTYQLFEQDELVLIDNEITGTPRGVADIKLMEKVGKVNGNEEYTSEEISSANKGAAVLLQYMTRFVDSDYDGIDGANNKYKTVQAAVDAANEGDVILVAPGVYEVTDTINVTKAITIKGAPDFATQIETSGGNPVFTLSAAATLDGLFILKEDKSNQHLVTITANGTRVVNSKFTGQYQQGDNEVARAIVSNAGVTGFVVSGNHFENLRQPGYLEGTGSVTDNFVKNTRGWVICVNHEVSLAGNTFEGNAVDIAIIANNQLDSDYYKDIAAISAGNNGAYVENQLLRVSARDGSLFVEAGDNQYANSIENAVKAARAGDTIHISGSFSGFIVDKPLTIIGGSIAPATLLGEPAGIYVTTAGSGTVIDGVEITGTVEPRSVGIVTQVNTELRVTNSNLTYLTTGIYLNPRSKLIAMGNTINNVVAGIGTERADLTGEVSGNTFTDFAEAIGLYLPLNSHGGLMTKEEAIVFAAALEDANALNSGDVVLYGDFPNELQIVLDTGQNETNKQNNRPHIEYEIDGRDITIRFINPTTYAFAFDYRIDGEEGEIGPWSDTDIKEGELAGQKIGPYYNIVNVGQEPVEMTVTAYKEIWIGLRLGAEQNWFLDWLKFEFK